MKKSIRIQVEPLSEQRWAKIERSLFSQLALETKEPTRGASVPRSRFGGRAWLLVAAVAGALGGAALAVRALPERPAIEQPSRITTGLSPSHLALSGLSLDVEPQSAVVVGAETPEGLLIVVDRGSVVCHVAPRRNHAPVIVQAGAARVRVVGTRFSVTRLGESARVQVQEGTVEVSLRGDVFRVHAGEEWPAPVAQPAPVEPSGTASAVPLAAPEPSASSTARHVATAVRTKSAPSSAPSAAAPADDDAPPPPSRQEIFERATLLERSDPARASSLYQSLESGGDSWAQHSLYARGRLEATRGNGTDARRLLERYLERFPNGGNAEDARAVLKRLR